MYIGVEVVNAFKWGFIFNKHSAITLAYAKIETFSGLYQVFFLRIIQKKFELRGFFNINLNRKFKGPRGKFELTKNSN